MNITVEYKDEATPFLNYIIQNRPKWKATALKSAGWRTSQELKKGIKSAAPGGAPYEPLHLDNTKRRALERVMGGKIRRNYPPMGQLQKAIGYYGKMADKGIVPVGWLSRTAVYLGDKQQQGYKTEITPKVRRLFAAAGIKLSKNKRVLSTPSRKTFAPMEAMLSRIARDQFASKLISYFNGNTERGTAASKRVYRVYK